MKQFIPWTIVHLDLSREIPALPQNEFQGTTLAFFWRGDIPLGQVEIPPDLRPLSSAEVMRLAIRAITPAVGARIFTRGFQAPLPVRKATSRDPSDLAELALLSNPLEGLEAKLRLSPLDARRQEVSLVVCTSDRPEALRRCLKSFSDLLETPGEVIVVDNGSSTVATRNVVSEFSDFRYVREPKKGLSVARNTGVRSSSGQIIVFTDDDVTVHPYWLTRVVKAFENPRTLAVTGLVLPGELQTAAQVRFQRGLGGQQWGFRAVDYGPDFLKQTQSYGPPVWLVGAGANMAFRSEAFRIVGLFDERLGAGASGCSEDSEMWYRILAEGWQCRYEPLAVVFHYHRREMRDLRKQFYAYMRGHVVALLVQFERYRHWGNLVRLFVVLPVYFFKAHLNLWLHGLRPKQQMLLVQVLGCLSGCLYYCFHGRIATARRDRIR